MGVKTCKSWIKDIIYAKSYSTIIKVLFPILSSVIIKSVILWKTITLFTFCAK